MASQSYGMTSSQMDIFLDQEKNPELPIYNIGGYVELNSAIDINLFRKAFNQQIKQYDVFGLRFGRQDNRPVQYHRDVQIPLTELDFSSKQNPQEAALQWITSIYHQAMDLQADQPLHYSGLICLGEQLYWYYSVSHHIIMDGWSYAIWVKNLIGQYMVEAGLSAAAAPVCEASFIPVAQKQQAHQHSKRYQKELDYWSQEIKNWPATCFDRQYANAGSTGETSKQVSSRRIVKNITQQQYTQWQQLATTIGGNIHHLFLAAVYLYFSRISNNKELVFGLPFHNRKGKEKQVIGSFVSVSPLRVDGTQAQTLADIVALLKRKLATHSRYQGFPIHQMVDLLEGPNSNIERLFDIQFNYQLLAYDAGNENCPTKTLFLSNDCERTPFTLTICEYGQQQDIQLQVDVNCEYFTAQEGELILARLLNIISQVDVQNDKAIADFELMTAAERHQLLDWAKVETTAPLEKSVDQLFVEMANQWGEKVAIEYGQTQLTYNELDKRSSQLAHWLIENGDNDSHYVALSLKRSPMLVVAMLACLKAGRGYLPLDGSYPQDRIESMLQQAKPGILLSDDEQFCQDFASYHVVDVNQSAFKEAVLLQHTDAPQRTLLAAGQVDSDIAYVMFTSGSTGQPKGVMVPHCGIVRLVKDPSFLPVDHNSRFLQACNISFDVATFEIFAPLLNGGTLVLYSEEQITVNGLNHVIEQGAVNAMWLTSALFDHWVNAIDGDGKILQGIKYMMAGGDVVSPQSVRKILQLQPNIQFINGYGPTENTTFSCCYPLPCIDALGERVAIGQPVSGSSAYVVDQDNQLQPVGVAGELLVGGYGLANGYLGQPKLSAEKFVELNLSGSLERLYRTGDIVYWRADGNLEYMGRADHQVKIRGFRVELAEIENSLRKVEGVMDAAVVYSATTMLVAFYVPSEGMGEESFSGVLNSHCYENLPSYMIPNRFIALDSLPANANGKLDRKLLLSQVPALDTTQQYQQAINETQLHIQAVWQRYLQAKIQHSDDKDISINANFFELGGNSLLAMEIIAQLSDDFGLQLSINKLFIYPTIELLAGHIDKLGTASLTGIEAQNPTQSLVLSHAQQQIVKDIIFSGDSAKYNIPGSFMVEGDFDPQLFTQALSHVIKRHSVLRSNISGDMEQLQVSVNDDFQLPLTFTDITTMTPAQQHNYCETAFINQGEKAFDLSTDLMLRGEILQLEAKRFMLLLTLHHVAADGWSLTVLFAELQDYYRQLKTNQSFNFTPLAIQYSDYAHWQQTTINSPAHGNDKQYWLNYLDGIAALHQLPTDKPRRNKPSYQGAAVTQLLDTQLTGQLNLLAAAQKTTLFNLLQTVYALVIGHWGQQKDVVMGTPVAGREQSAVAQLIGCFTNTLVMRTQIDSQQGFTDLLAQSHQHWSNALAHQSTGFEQIVNELTEQRDHRVHPVFQLWFVLHSQTAPGDDFVLEGCKVEQQFSASQRVKFDLMLAASEKDGQLELKWQYSTDLFVAATIENMAQSMQTLLQNIVKHMAKTSVKNSDVKVADLLLTNQDTQSVIKGQALTDAKARFTPLTDLVDKTANANGQSIALVEQQFSLTYAQLQQKVDRLAALLMDLEVSRTTPVAILMDRSCEAIVSILAILKVGATYVPIDPKFPEGRIGYIIDDVKPQVILSCDQHFEKVANADSELVIVSGMRDQDWLDDVDEVEQWPTVGIDDSFYMIYTSGTTGNPKGTVLTHGNVASYVAGMTSQYAFDSGLSYALNSSLATDLGNTSLLLCLSLGGTLHLLSDELMLQGHSVSEYLSEHPIDVFKITPSQYISLCEPKLYASPVPRQFLIFGGESLSPAALKLVSEAPAYIDGPANNCSVVNHYGPTEACIGCISKKVELNDDSSSIALGRPMPGRDAVIVDSHQQPVVKGAWGELLIVGDNVSPGYHHRPELNQEKFIPFAGIDGLASGSTIAYRTGDKVRLDSHGELIFAGRLDEQVKIRGYRVELGEINSALATLPNIEQAAVLFDQSHDLATLIAFVVTENKQSTISIDSVKTALARQLPDYMVPQQVVVIEQLPRLANGKINFQALKSQAQHLEQGELCAPQNPLQLQLSEIWQELLQNPMNNIDIGFFEAGGNSLLVTRLSNQIRINFDLQIPVRLLMENPSIRHLAWLIEDANKIPDTNTSHTVDADLIEIEL